MTIEAGNCSFCGVKHPRCVSWLGASANILCCTKCSENVLPMMIGDSLYLEGRTNIYHVADKEWNGRFKVRFLRAVMARCVVKPKVD